MMEAAVLSGAAWLRITTPLAEVECNRAQFISVQIFTVEGKKNGIA